MAKDTNDANGDVAAMPFEKALAELEQIVGKLESGNVALEDSIKIYERGEALKRRCDALLKDAETRVDKIITDSKGKPTGSTPLDQD